MPKKHKLETIAKMRLTWLNKRITRHATTQIERVCTACDLLKPSEAFGVYSGVVGSRPSAGRLRHRCLTCDALYSALNKRKHRDLNPEKSWISRALTQAKIRANKRAINFTITAEILKQKLLENTNKCIYCSKRLIFFAEMGALHDVASLDQIQAGGGYTVENVAICCTRCNTLKTNATLEELRTLVTGMERLLQQTSARPDVFSND